MNPKLRFSIAIYTLLFSISLTSQSNNSFSWPDGKKAAISLSFDDARQSHPKTGRDLFRRIGGKATFYVNPPAMLYDIEGWKDLVADGHEIGNHTINHPCTGNFLWSRDKSLESYSLATMEQELLEANQQIYAMLGVHAVSFAYTCGNSFVGRGANRNSYVPLVAKHFKSGRGWLNEPPNDPLFSDMAMLQGNEMDGKNFKNDIKPMIDAAIKNGSYLLLAGHEIGIGGAQTVEISMLEELLDYLNQPDCEVWLGTVGEVSEYIKQSRFAIASNLKSSLTFCSTFDKGTSANYALGDNSIYTIPSYDKRELASKGLIAQEIAIAESKGLVGNALEFKRKSRPAIFYKAKDNFTYSEESWDGSVSFWLSLDPEEDLAPGYTDPIQITDATYNDGAFWVDFSETSPRQFRLGVFGEVEQWNPKDIDPDKHQPFLDRLVTSKLRPFARSKWTHVAITFSGINSSSAKASLYLNGKHQGTRQINESFEWDVEKAKIFLGINFIGLMDELSLFSKELTQQEVSSLYQLPGGIGDLLKQ